MADSNQPPKDFTRGILPWLVIAAAAGLYTFTVNHWVTLSSLPLTARVTGWDWWNHSVERPLFLILTLPIRWLPQGGQVLALNVFSVLCAALALGVLARSVGLLPHDRTREQRQIEHHRQALLTARWNWLPVLLAVALCGLQLTFWQNAIAATGESLDLLLFAYAIRCLLEYRVSQKEGWLIRLTVVYGLGVANNWAMIGFFPLFLCALVWIMGARFFNGRFVLRTAGLGLLGLSLYLVLPLAPSLSNAPGEAWTEILRQEWGAQKNILFAFPVTVIGFMAMTSILPVALIGIRWPAAAGETSPVAGSIANLVFRVAHLALLVVMILLAFDPEFSPRNRGFGLPFLTFYYLSALAAGYYSGYLLLVFGPATGNTWERPSALMRWLGRAITAFVWLAAFAVPVALVRQNYPAIQTETGPAVREFARALATAVAAPNAIVVSANPQHLLLFTAARTGLTDSHVLVDLSSVANPKYYRVLQQKYPARLPALNAHLDLTNTISSLDIGRLVDLLAHTNDIYMLEPAYGNPFLEADYIEPHGLVYAIKPYGTNNTVTPPPLPPEVIADNQSFWTAATGLLPWRRSSAKGADADVNVIGDKYSAGLNHWAVELQKLGRYEEAGRLFQKAMEFNPQNAVAKINRTFNQSLLPGHPDNNVTSSDTEDLVGKFRTWNSLLNADGPPDEPRTCYQLGTALAQARFMRQAALQFLRAQTLSPTNIQPRLRLGEVFFTAGMPDEALNVVRQTRADPAFKDLPVADETALMRLEAFSLLKSDLAGAERILLAGNRKYPKEVSILDSLVEVYLQSGRVTNALTTTEQVLKISPDHLSALLTQGAIYVQLRQFDHAITVLDRALRLYPNHLGALIYRANAHLGATNLPAAERDYHQALDIAPNLPGLQMGLGEVAARQKRAPEAIRYFEQALQQIPTNSPYHKQVSQRLAELKAGAK